MGGEFPPGRQSGGFHGDTSNSPFASGGGDGDEREGAMSAAVARTLLVKKVRAILASPRWRLFVPKRHKAVLVDRSLVASAFHDSMQRVREGKPPQLEPSKLLPRVPDLLRQTVLPVGANMVSGLVLFHTFEVVLEDLQRNPERSGQLLPPLPVPDAVLAGAAGGAAHALVAWPLEKFIVPGLQGDMWQRRRGGVVMRRLPPPAYAQDAALTGLRDTTGFAIFFGVYGGAKQAITQAVTAKTSTLDRHLQEAVQEHDMTVRVGTSLAAGLLAGVAFGAFAQPFEALRLYAHQVYAKQEHECQSAEQKGSKSKHRKAPESPSVAKNQPGPEISPVGGRSTAAAQCDKCHQIARSEFSVLKMVRTFVRRTLIAAPANAIAIIAYELASMSMFDESDARHDALHRDAATSRGRALD